MTIPTAPQFEFGPGICWITPVTNYLGVPIVNPSPMLFGAMQDCSLDFSADLKQLFGTFAAPLAIGRGKQKYAIKLKNAQTHGRLWNAAFFGQTLTNGEIYDAIFDTTGNIIPATPFQVTVDPPGSGTILYPLGVRDQFNVPLTLVTGTPITRQYAYAAGVFTFAAADAGLNYYIDYRYTATGAGAPQTLVIGNPVMGYAPTFQFDMKIPYNGMNFNATFPSCTAGKLGFATKLDDFSYPEFDFEAFAPGNAGVGTLSWSQ